MKKLSYLILLFLIIAACKKERIEPNDYPFVFGSTNKGSITCDKCNNIDKLDEFIEIDKNFNIYVRNEDGKILYKGKFNRFKLVNKEFKVNIVYNEYDARLPSYIDHYNYVFSVRINSFYTNKYSKVLDNILQFRFEIIPRYKTELINGDYIPHIDYYSIILKFESNYRWDLRQKMEIKYQYGFTKKLNI
ncbi:MAG: hypothetical protein ACK4IK_05755 [Bacteroidia bacterium]